MKTTFHIIAGIILILLGLNMSSCEKKTNTNFSIEGKIDNLSVDKIALIKEITSDSLVLDTISINEKGEFSYNGTVDEATMMALYIGKETAPVSMLVEPGYNVRIKGDAVQADLIEIKGGQVNDDINEFNVRNASLLQSRHRILSKNENLDPAELRNINLQLGRSVREYVDQNPTKIASVILMNNYSINNISVEALGEDIEKLKGVAANFYMTTDLKAYYDKVKVSAVGAVAPEIELKNIRGKNVKLTDLRGKPVLLIFDLKDSPTNTVYFDKLKDTQKALKDSVQFVSIVIDDNPKSPDPHTVETAKSLKWTVLLDGKKWNSKEVKKYNVTSAPYMILISKEGLIQERGVELDSLKVKFAKKEK